jgi:hypothetical protein
MSFLLSEEMTQFRDSLNKMFSEAISPELRRFRIHNKDTIHNSALMQLFRDGELFSLWTSKELAAEAGTSALMVIAIEAGHCLVPESLVDYLFYGPFLLSLVENKELDELKSKVSLGTKLVSGALDSFTGRVRFTGESKADQRRKKQCLEIAGFIPTHFITGSVAFMEGAEGANFAVVNTPDGVVYLVSMHSGVTFAPIRPVDESLRAAELVLKSASALRLDTVEKKSLDLPRSLLAAAEMYGAATKALMMTIEYVRSRTQFGKPIGSFQTIQQGLASAYLDCEALFSLLQFACWSLDKDPRQAQAACSAAMILAQTTMSSVCEKSIQYHGGIGFTWEYDLHLYMRRVKLREMMFHYSESEMVTFLSSLEGVAQQRAT